MTFLPRVRNEATVWDAEPVMQDRKLGVSRSLLTDGWQWPIHGLRHPSTTETSGWYIWTGELEQGDDFFVPLHESHLWNRHPVLTPLLELSPGTRFLIAPGHEDVWRDEALLDV
jgi:hypothetical protein